MQYNYFEHNSFQPIKIQFHVFIRTFFLIHIKTNKMADEQVANRKLSGDEKDILIDFFEKNKPLW